MSEQILIQFEADKELKQEVTDIYERLGMDLPTAFHVFMKRSKQVGGFPFKVSFAESGVREDFKSAFYSLREEAKNIPEMSIDEIDAEIAASRAERKKM